MKFSFLSAVYGIATVGSAYASGPVKVDFQVYRGNSRNNAGPNRPAQLVKRANPDGSESMQLDNEQSFYKADLQIGSNGQKVGVLVDTGSSDLWVMPPDVQCVIAQNRKRSPIYQPFDRYPVPDYEELYERKVRFHDWDDSEMDPDTDIASSSEEKREYQAVARNVQREDRPGTAPAATVLKRDQDSASKVTASPSADLPVNNRDDCHGLFCVFSTIIVTGSSIPTGLTQGGGGGGGGGSPTQTGAQTNTCTDYGSFLTEDSNSWSANKSAPAFYIQYADGTSANGQWGQDTVLFGNANVSDLSFALVNKSDSKFGVLGIGLAGLESTYSTGSSTSRPYTYENLPLRMKALGIIKKVVYSLYLSSKKADSGTLLFGAVDKAKYSGQLQTVPIINVYEGIYKNPIRLDVALSGLSFESLSQNETISTSSYPALLDSGTTLTYLPPALLRRLGQLFSGSYSDAYGMFRISCNFNTNSAFVVFNFSGIKIRVPVADLIIRGGTNTCYLGVQEQSSRVQGQGYATLGDNFLRSAYVVYDLEDYTISMAQANYADQEDISVIESLIPNAVSASDYSATSFASASETDSGLSVTALSSNGLKKSSAGKNYRLQWPLLIGAGGAALLAWA